MGSKRDEKLSKLKGTAHFQRLFKYHQAVELLHKTVIETTTLRKLAFAVMQGSGYHTALRDCLPWLTGDKRFKPINGPYELEYKKELVALANIVGEAPVSKKYAVPRQSLRRWKTELKNSPKFAAYDEEPTQQRQPTEVSELEDSLYGDVSALREAYERGEL